MAVTQAWLWFLGVLLFSRGQMGAGLEGHPRRVPSQGLLYSEESWEGYNLLTGIGGTVMFISGVLFFVVLFRTLAKQPSEAPVPMPVSETVHGADEAPQILDRIGFWVIVTFVLIAIAYVPVFLSHTYEFNSPGFTLF
jgi:cytochrome c oxidase subunit 1